MLELPYEHTRRELRLDLGGACCRDPACLPAADRLRHLQLLSSGLDVVADMEDLGWAQ